MAELPAALTITIHGDLDPSQHAAVDRLETTAFSSPEWTAAQWQEQADRYDGDADRVGYALAHVGTELVGSMRLFERAVPFNGRTVRLGGIGAVATDPDWRGRGIAEATLIAAMEELRRHGAEVAYLCAVPELGRRLYAKAGFAPLGRPYTYRGRSGTPYTDHDGWLAPLTDPALCAAMLTDTEPLDLAGSNW